MTRDEMLTMAVECTSKAQAYHDIAHFIEDYEKEQGFSVQAVGGFALVKAGVELERAKALLRILDNDK